MRIGIFGGSFDPVHIGHLIVAEAAADALRLDQVRFVPAYQQPIKWGRHVADPEHRVAMLGLALAGNPRFVLDLRERERGGASYTVDTLESLRADFPKDQLFLMVGADAARELPEWRAAERIPGLCTVVALSRAGASAPVGDAVACSVQVPAVAISATDIRDAVREGRSIRYLVPPGVAEYIATNSLYR